MSQKITAKNLTYSQNLPPFLVALQAQASGRTGPDPMLAAHRRPVKKRSASEEAEDAPLVLDTEGNVVAGVTVGVDGAASLVRTANEDEDDDSAGAAPTTTVDKGQPLGDSHCMAGVGASKKRKMGKVVGGEGPEEEEAAAAEAASGARRRDGPKAIKATKDDKSKKDKKKSKKIKLSFEDDDGV